MEMIGQSALGNGDQLAWDFQPDSPHQFYGVMSAIEWVQFLILHCNRHIEQLRELAVS